MTDNEWEQQRQRAILAAFQTGRPVFADTDGELRYTDGDREQLAEDTASAAARGTSALAVRAERASHVAFVMTIVAAIANGIAGVLWHPWQLAIAAVFAGSAVVWRHVNRRQRASSRRADAQDPTGVPRR
jgi:hypothetical protein